jgi:hypothetical protein
MWVQKLQNVFEFNLRMRYEYLIFLNPLLFYKHHFDALKENVSQHFPTDVLSLINKHTIMIGDCNPYAHIPIKFVPSKQSFQKDRLLKFILEFVNKEEGHVFSMRDLILDHGLYEVVPVS